MGYKVENLASPEQAAEELLSKLYGDKKITIPINVWDVASKLGIEAKPGIFEGGVSGVLYKDAPNTPFLAMVNIFEAPVRQRFTLAHEIGHYIHKYQTLPAEKVAGKVEKRDELSSMGIDEEEIWANKFAAALLMPEHSLRKAWSSGELYEDIAKRFSVSRAALGNRLDTLNLY